MSCGRRPVYETLDSIDEVWRSQDQKVELSCFSQKVPNPNGFLQCCAARLSLFHISTS